MSVDFESRKNLLEAIKNDDEEGIWVGFERFKGNPDILSDALNVAILHQKKNSVIHLVNLLTTEDGEIISLIRDIDYHKTLTLLGLRDKKEEISFLLSVVPKKELLRDGLMSVYRLSIERGDQSLFDFISEIDPGLQLSEEDIEELKIKNRKFNNVEKNKEKALKIEAGLRFIGIEV